MNVLYIGNYRDSPSGWSCASEMWVRALNKAVPNLAIRYFNYSDKQKLLDPLFDELESRVFDHYDIVIQNLLPPNLEKIDGPYNIAICYFESDGVLTNNVNNWGSKLTQMNEAWMTTSREITEVETIKLKATQIPQCIDLYQIQKNDTKTFNPSTRYRFYAIGSDTSPRKNIYELIVAYFLAFDKYDNVELILKVSNSGPINKLINELTQSMSHKELAPILVFSQSFTDEQMIGVHNVCDCFINPASEESIGRPLMEACIKGKNVLVTANTSMCELVTSTPNQIDSHRDPCLVDRPPVPGIYTIKETWHMPHILSLKDKMLQCYKGKIKPPITNMNPYDIKHVSRLIAERLKEIYASL